MNQEVCKQSIFGGVWKWISTCACELA